MRNLARFVCHQFVCCQLACSILSGCVQPNLIVAGHQMQIVDGAKTSRLQIHNAGSGNAGPFLIYVTGLENPPSTNHIPQLTHSVTALSAGQTIDLEGDFGPLAHPDNAMLANLRSMSVEVDPKDDVVESSETDNALPTTPPSNYPKDAEFVPAAVMGNLGVDASQTVSQTFTAAGQNVLWGIELSIVRCEALPTDTLTVELWQESTRLASGAIEGFKVEGPGLCGVYPRPLASWRGGPGFVYLRTDDVTLFPGVTYEIRLSSTSSRDFRVGFSGAATGAGYPGGSILVNGSPFPFGDLCFKVLLDNPL